jgi:hypothetical protein
MTVPAMNSFLPGTRVRILAGSEWPEGATGRVAGTTSIRPEPDAPPIAEWRQGARVVPTLHGHGTYYLVEFDSPQDDGSGDGPYTAGEVEEALLSTIESQASGPTATPGAGPAGIGEP